MKFPYPQCVALTLIYEPSTRRWLTSRAVSGNLLFPSPSVIRSKGYPLPSIIHYSLSLRCVSVPRRTSYSAPCSRRGNGYLCMESVQFAQAFFLGEIKLCMSNKSVGRLRSDIGFMIY